MWSSRRRLPRRSLSSPPWSMAHSLSICGVGERAAHFGRPLELQPVARPLQDDELVRPLDVTARGLAAVPAEGWILIAPEQDGRRHDRTDVAQALPSRPARAHVG